MLSSHSGHRRRTTVVLLLLLLALLPEPLAAQAATGAPVEEEGAAALGVALRRLGTTKRVLMIAAHPDDENTALIAELALGQGADVAYLSLTRGEGGQNLIGPELQEALGVIRSEELLAARRLDGARQYFARAVDFGFSKAADETLRHWPREEVTADAVEIVRRHRPDIVVTVFGGTPADGHGQHQAAGLVARAAFTAAGDAALFPEHAARGLAPHAPRYLFQAHWRPPPDPPLAVETGTLDPLFGRSRFQIAMRSRSRHRSQDMGQAESPGAQRVALTPLDGHFPGGARSLFAGLDTTLVQHALSALAPERTVALLRAYEDSVHAVRAAFNPLRPHELVPALRAMLQDLREAGRAAPPALQFLLDRELDKTAHALRLAAGFVFDAVADTPLPVAGESFTLTVTVWNGGASEPVLRSVQPVLPDGWSHTALDDSASRTLRAGEVVRRRFRVDVPRTAQPTEPYFLRAERSGSLYEWPVADSVRGLPFEPRPVRAAALLDAGVPLPLEAEATHVIVDKAMGELRRPLLVVEPVDVAVEPRLIVAPAGDRGARTLTVTVRANVAAPLRGRVVVDAPSGWHVEPADADVALDQRGDARSVRFTLVPLGDGAHDGVASARFVTSDATFTRGHTLIDYPHIRPHALYRGAATRVMRFPVAIAAGLRIGFIEGAGDDAAAALRQLGADVATLGPLELASADLSGYDAIIAGIRAYEVRPDLIAHNDRLLDYARRGGTLIVQYNKYELVELGLMPYPAGMARPHGRVTDPAAPVTLLAPEHPLLSGPNRITVTDFAGWVHERGLYFLDSFDARYTPLLAMSDAGEAPLAGGLVAARVGSGWYVYTGLALFRQLPEGVPGAWRLLANLASLGRSAAAP